MTTEPKWFGISGSRHTTRAMRDYAKSAVNRIFERGDVLLVGDNHQGIDKIVIGYAIHNSYGPGIMYTGLEKPRALESLRGFRVTSQSPKALYTLRDQVMVDFCDAVMFIWDGKSQGTYKAYQYARKQGVECWLVDFSKEDKKTGRKPLITAHPDDRSVQERIANMPKQDVLF